MLRKLLGRRNARKSGPEKPSAAAEPATKRPAALPDDDDLPALPFAIRPMVPGDEQALAAIFIDAIDGLAEDHYGARQRKAWKKTAGEQDFAAALAEGVTIVAENQGEPIAFAQLHPSDHIRMLYVHSEWSGLGISTLLYQYLEDEARIAGAQVLTTEASLRAQRFFEQMGFVAGEQTTVKRHGVSLARLPMRKQLVSG